MLNMAPHLQRAEAHFGAILSPEWPSSLLPRNFFKLFLLFRLYGLQKHFPSP